MSGGRLTWKKSMCASERGYGGRLNLFTVSYGTRRQEAMYSLSTSLPLKSSRLGQHYADADEAKAMAEKLLAAFIKEVTATEDSP